MSASFYIQRVLTLLERTLGPEHPNLAAALDNYADLLRKMQHKAEAETAEARARRSGPSTNASPLGSKTGHTIPPAQPSASPLSPSLLYLPNWVINCQSTPL